MVSLIKPHRYVKLFQIFRFCIDTATKLMWDYNQPVYWTSNNRSPPSFYLEWIPHKVSRGCPNRANYCTNIQIHCLCSSSSKSGSISPKTHGEKDCTRLIPLYLSTRVFSPFWELSATASKLYLLSCPVYHCLPNLVCQRVTLKHVLNKFTHQNWSNSASVINRICISFTYQDTNITGGGVEWSGVRKAGRMNE